MPLPLPPVLSLVNLKDAESNLGSVDGPRSSKVRIKVLGVLGTNYNAVAAGARREVRETVVVESLIRLGLCDGLLGTHEHLKGTVEAEAAAKVIRRNWTRSVLIVKGAGDVSTDARAKTVELEAQRDVRGINDELRAEPSGRLPGMDIPGTSSDGTLEVGIGRFDEVQRVRPMLARGDTEVTCRIPRRFFARFLCSTTTTFTTRGRAFGRCGLGRGRCFDLGRNASNRLTFN